ncbi:hypothetical protein AURDEDRAFT_110140 [Auricularia subglabra TFB-10046 SS5]|nr:hypothetical protein AURDEDRAFT_110140 [Auricularia subglabra TFB-10046 SS5]
MPLKFNPPPELLLEIFEFAGAEPWGVFCADHQTLRSCALVSRSWAPCAQRVLFKRAVFDTCDDGRPNRFNEFHATLKALRTRCSNLPDAVRIMSVDVGVAHVGEATVRHAQLRTVAEAVQMCPNLLSLQLFLINEGIHAIRFNEEELALLAQTQNINHLSIIGTVEDDVLLCQTLALWPITRLTVEFSGYYSITRRPPGLELETFQALDEPPLEFLDHLVRCPTVTMRCLRIHTVSDLDMLIRPFTHTVREIFLGFPEPDDGASGSGAQTLPEALPAGEPNKWTWPDADVFAECEVLERFGVGAPANRAMLDALPASVHTLGISPHTCSADDITLIMDFLSRRPKVCTVEIQVYRNSMYMYDESMRAVAPLRAFCLEKDIVVNQREMEYCLFPIAY